MLRLNCKMIHAFGSTFFLTIITALTIFSRACFGQVDSVDVTFVYRPSGNPSTVYLPGEFNGWVIGSSLSAMTYDPIHNRWEKTVRLRRGGPVPLPDPGKSIPGAYQYKFNENGNSNGWLPDPLNPRQNPLDNNNSILFINDPTIHYLMPNSVSGLEQTRFPEISASLFPSVGTAIDTGSIQIIIDETVYQNIGSGYDSENHTFNFTLPDPVSNGTHKLKLIVRNSNSTENSDSTTFIVQAGFIQWFTQSNDRFLRSTKIIQGAVEDTTIHEAVIHHNNDSTTVAVTDGLFSELVNLTEGENRFYASVTDMFDQREVSDTIAITYFIDHTPKPEIQITQNNSEVVLAFSANDPDGDAVTAHWVSDDTVNPEKLFIDSEMPEIQLSVPSLAGEYYFDLEVFDPDSNRGITRSVFCVDTGGTVTIPAINSNPEWVRDGIVYEIYLPAFTTEGTFQSAKERLPEIQSLGASIIWLMPIYPNNETINEFNAGYNVTDFYQVHPQFGTMADFEDFLDEAHKLGLRVILDSTPNHVSENHQWLQDVKLYQDYSNNRPMIETRILGDNRGLGQSVKRIGNYNWYAYYSNWTLANLNYSSIETIDCMMQMYKWWILEKGIDGYRMDVYWGPQNRYGKAVWWHPFREEIKRIKPDILIVGETDGTGTGSENNYADHDGASDAAYDWNLYGQIKSVLNGGSISELDSRVRNYSPTLEYNYYTGSNARYFRFLENHDEDRITSLFAKERAKAGAVFLLTIPGIPMIYAGQEVGETSRRGEIEWSRTLGTEFLQLYQRLCRIRNTFRTFRSSEIKRIVTDQSRVYSFLRPYFDQNGIVVLNFSSSPVEVQLTIDPASLILNTDSLLSGKTYYLNDVLNDTVFETSRTDISGFTMILQEWASAVMILADSVIHLPTGIQYQGDRKSPFSYELFQNYPNPFNATTVISYYVGGSGCQDVEVKVYNVLGEEVRTLVHQIQNAGKHRIVWDGQDNLGRSVSTGLYFYQFKSNGIVRNRKMVVLK